MSDEPVFIIEVPVEDLTGMLILREEIGTGTFGDDEVGLFVGVPIPSPVVEFRGKTYAVNINDISEAIVRKALDNA